MLIFVVILSVFVAAYVVGGSDATEGREHDILLGDEDILPEGSDFKGAVKKLDVLVSGISLTL